MMWVWVAALVGTVAALVGAARAVARAEQATEALRAEVRAAVDVGSAATGTTQAVVVAGAERAALRSHPPA